VGDYGIVRDEIAAIYPAIFHDFNARMWTPGGFRRPLPAAERQWKTPNGKANFKTPRGFDEDPDVHAEDHQVLRLMTRVVSCLPPRRFPSGYRFPDDGAVTSVPMSRGSWRRS
jgi:hypothetical protein